MPEKATHYVVVTPVRDEEQHLPATIQSMICQTVLPKEWVIVNDGSKDSTAKIIDGYAGRYPWIKAVHRKDRGFRKAGGGVVDAFNDGYQALTFREWDFVVKFDGDLQFDSTYFENCFKEFDRDPKLGIGGGVICYVTDGVKSFEDAPGFHVRGATKIYRKACWDEIGGLLPAAGWDTIDEVKANSLGWTTRSFPRLHLIHERETGSADGRWRSFVKYGRANYMCGYHPLFMAGKCLAGLTKKPYGMCSVGLMYGFLSGYLLKIPQFDEQKAIQYLRGQQLRRMFGGETIYR